MNESLEAFFQIVRRRANQQPAYDDALTNMAHVGRYTLKGDTKVTVEFGVLDTDTAPTDEDIHSIRVMSDGVEIIHILANQDSTTVYSADFHEPVSGRSAERIRDTTTYKFIEADFNGALQSRQ